MQLNKLSLNDEKLFKEHLSSERHDLSVYAFQNIYIWRPFFEIEWAIIGGSLCVFFTDKIGRFLYLPPLGVKPDGGIIKLAFSKMDELNKNTQVSRIENIEEKDIKHYQCLGLNCQIKSCDYIYDRNVLSGLSGAGFKSKRCALNYFLKHNQFELSALRITDAQECLVLYKYWMSSRSRKNRDSLYLGLMQDSLLSLKEALRSFEQLDFQGIAVRIKNELKGFTLGYKLNKDTFCILYEVADLSVKGLAQFIFREFCSELADFKYINVMDDSGLASLRKVKLSYRPCLITQAYTAVRNR